MLSGSLAHPGIAEYLVLTFLLAAPVLVLAGRMVGDILSAHTKTADPKQSSK